MRVARQAFRVAPGVGRIRTVGRLGSVFEHGFDIVGLVEGKVDGLADFRLVQWRMLTVDADECCHERVSLFDFQRWLFQRFLYVQRLGRQGDLAFVTAQFLQAHIGVRGDGEDQRVYRGFAAEVFGVGFVANRGVLLETGENERPCADRLAVELLGCAGLHQFVGVFGRIDRGEAHAQGRQEGRIRVVEGEAHGLRIEGVDLLDQCRQLHRLRMREAALGDFVPRIGRVEHAVEAENHVFGAQVTRRGEVLGAMEFHLRVQLEHVDQAIGADFPAIGEAGDHFATGRVKVHQAIHQHIGRGIGGGQRVVLHHVEPFRAGLGADAQGGGKCLWAQQKRGEQQR
ncbi:hypothetical protein D3C86_1302060 [compost metagenome]